MHWLLPLLGFLLVSRCAGQLSAAKVDSVSTSLVTVLRQFGEGAAQEDILQSIQDLEQKIYTESDGQAITGQEKPDPTLDTIMDLIETIQTATEAVATLDSNIASQQVLFDTFDVSMHADNVADDAKKAQLQEIWRKAKADMANTVTTVQLQAQDLRDGISAVYDGMEDTKFNLAALGQAQASAASNKNIELLAKILLLADIKQKCLDIDMCKARRPCLNDGVCIRRDKSYECVCKEGFMGVNCEINVDDCVAGKCLNGGTCIDQVNGYVCKCAVGYEGENCQIDIDECVLYENPCNKRGSCVDGVGAFSCNCFPGFEGDKCEKDINECLANPCQNNGFCQEDSEGNGYRCYCMRGYSGTNCELNKNDCVPMPCMNGATCTDGLDEYTCNCVDGYRGSTCDTEVDLCAEHNIKGADDKIVSDVCLNGGACINVRDSNNKLQIQCVCATGWSGANCQANVDDCVLEAGDPGCGKYGFCVDGLNSYTCNCQPGFTGEKCTDNTNDCEPNKCLNGAVCKDGINMYSCVCPPGFSGERCEKATGAWVLLAQNAFYEGASFSTFNSLAGGYFTKIKAVYRSGYISCSYKFPENKFKWNICHREGQPSNDNIYSFELLIKNSLVLAQPSWDKLPPSCVIPDTPSGPIICDVMFRISKTDPISPSWYTATRAKGTTGTQFSSGKIFVDIYGFTAPNKVSSVAPKMELTANIPTLGNTFTWTDAAAYCSQQTNFNLCNFFDYCPDGESHVTSVVPPLNSDFATTTWVPYSNANGETNTWVQLDTPTGDSGPCRPFSSLNGVAPDWGTLKVAKSWKRMIMCCFSPLP